MKRDRQDGAILDHFRIINVGFRETFGLLPERPPGLAILLLMRSTNLDHTFQVRKQTNKFEKLVETYGNRLKLFILKNIEQRNILYISYIHKRNDSFKIVNIFQSS